MKKSALHFLHLLKQSYREWGRDNALRLSAALSYYTVFSIGPMLLLVLGISGLLVGEAAVRGELSRQVEAVMGIATAQSIEAIIASTQKSHTGFWATLTGIVVIFIGATTVFAELESSLNFIWRAQKPKSWTWAQLIKARLLSFGLVLAIGFLFLVSLIVNVVLTAASDFINSVYKIPALFFQLAFSIVSLAMATVLFALIFKILPSVKINWRHVWLGAFLTAVFFTIGRSLFGLYLGYSGAANSFGASAAVVLVMLWAYYSSVVLFFGAEFTKVVAQEEGVRLAHPVSIYRKRRA